MKTKHKKKKISIEFGQTWEERMKAGEGIFINNSLAIDYRYAKLGHPLIWNFIWGIAVVSTVHPEYTRFILSSSTLSVCEFPFIIVL